MYNRAAQKLAFLASLQHAAFEAEDTLEDARGAAQAHAGARHRILMREYDLAYAEAGGLPRWDPEAWEDITGYERLWDAIEDGRVHPRNVNPVRDLPSLEAMRTRARRNALESIAMKREDDKWQHQRDSAYWDRELDRREDYEARMW